MLSLPKTGAAKKNRWLLVRLKTVYPPKTTFCGGYKKIFKWMIHGNKIHKILKYLFGI